MPPSRKISKLSSTEMQTQHAILGAAVLGMLLAFGCTLPVLDASSGLDNATIEELQASLNDTPKNL